MNVGIWGWNEVVLPLVSQWRKLHVDAAGDVQVDVLSSELPDDAATETTLDLVRAELDGIEGLLAGGLPSVLDTDSLKVREQNPPADPSTGGRQDVQTDLISLIRILLAARLPAALDTLALKVREQGTPSVNLKALVDSIATSLVAYTGGILKVGRAEVGLLCSGVKSGDAAIKESAGKVYWMSVSDTAALSIELNDSTDGAGTDKWAAVLPASCYGHYIFDPPLEFANGIYLDVSTATCLVVVGYL